MLNPNKPLTALTSTRAAEPPGVREMTIIDT